MSKFTLPKLTDDLNIIQSLSDQPSLTATELKAKFDEGTNLIKDYINNILLENINNVLDTLDNYEGTIDSKIKEKFEKIYHIGKIIVTSEDINPATYLGFGKWENIGKGKVLIGVDDNNVKYNKAGKTGGSATIKLEEKHLPSFNLSNRVVTGIESSQLGNFDYSDNPASFTRQAYMQMNLRTENIGFTNGEQQSIDITPEYQTVYRFVRVE